MPCSLSKCDNKVKENLGGNLSGWDKAINDAKRMIVRLQRAVKTYAERRDAGELWPGETAGTAVESAPAEG